MKEKYLEVLEKYLPKNYLIEDIANELLNLHSVSGSTDKPKPYEWLKVEKFNITHGSSYNEPKFSIRQCASWISEYVKKYYR